jgi:AcrR family transcriptional regulator
MENKKESRRETLINTGKDLFLKHGFRRVSIEDICKKAGISKMTFYRYFANKTELARTVYSTLMEEGLQEFRKIMNDDCSPQDKIRKMLLLKLEGTNQISQEFLVDFYTSREAGLKDFVMARTRELWLEVIGDIREAQKQGTFREDFNPGFFYLVSQKLTESLDDPEISKLFDNPQAMIMELANLLMYGIAPRK